MEGNESLLDIINEDEEETLGDLEDVVMLEARITNLEVNDRGDGDVDPPINGSDCVDQERNHESRGGNGLRKKKRNRRKNKKKKGPASSVTDINRFVIETCRHLKEKKSYLIWNAVGCLGVSAVSDLVKEVNTIQDFGGQMTCDGKRFRTGGGILWKILRTREPKAYKEIMAKGKEFERQFRQQCIRQMPNGHKVAGSHGLTLESDEILSQVSDSSQLTLEGQSESTTCDSRGERISVQNRIRVPVSYDDLFEDDAKDESLDFPREL